MAHLRIDVRRDESEKAVTPDAAHQLYVLHSLIVPPPTFSPVWWVVFIAALVASVSIMVGGEYVYGAFLIALNSLMFWRVRVSYRRALQSHTEMMGKIRAHAFAMSWAEYCRRMHGEG